MTKEQMMEVIKLLSAIESWSFAEKRQLLPDYLHDQLQATVNVLTVEVLR